MRPSRHLESYGSPRRGGAESSRLGFGARPDPERSLVVRGVHVGKWGTSRRAGILTAGLLIGMTGVAAANLTYQPGAYNVDPCSITTARPCSNDDNGRLRMTVKKGSFTVQRISLTETCSNGVRSFRERFTFLAGPNARLAGGIGRQGHLSARF